MSTPSPLSHRLWNSSVTAHDYSTPGGEKYQAAILEQYKIYVEMADRVSARRSLTNTFFLTVNTAFLAGASTLARNAVKHAPAWALLISALVAVIECVVWLLLINSYKQLNGAKYKVIGEMEKRLPALLYGDAEWKELGEGQSRSRYFPLTHVEQVVPIVFAALYLVAMGVAMTL
ncbi:hypothetical protein ADL07_01895 [Streptomyces sp. NRRL F-4707]|uniref:RipA family octameric membrane protein n=1 Tax=Streptomyces sp. NRRL F-4707 TaxID=1519496 RepID=UPI0006AF2B32|nr:hypothetical protein [Streptomyces sp. NRRL F-4707]KOX38990.1 hypothetical protein ADL07_01895 [Streptomyces sp. NRRL F-4707]